MNLDCKKTFVSVCNGPRCAQRFSQYVQERAEAESAKKDSVEVRSCNCCGKCEKGVNVKIEKKGKVELHSYVDPIKMAKIINHS